MTGHDFNFGFVQLTCLSTLYSLYRAWDTNFKAETTFSLQPSCIFNFPSSRVFFFSSFWGRKGRKERRRGREGEGEREGERGRLWWILSSKTSERTNKRQNRSWSCVAYQTPWYHIRVANVSLSKVPTYSLGPPLAPCTHTYGTIGFPTTSTTYLYPPLTSPPLPITVVGQRLSSFSFLFPRFLIPSPDNVVALKPGCTCKRVRFLFLLSTPLQYVRL